jgi:uncharacterized protein YecE (DUF72 family)
VAPLIRIGTAGWAVPRAVAAAFPAEGSGLQRYAARFACAEINTTFYRPHQPKTFARWAETTPPGFRFAVKLPKAISHDARLAGPLDALDAFLEQVACLGDKLGPLLVQLPPGLPFDPEVAARFTDALRERFDGPVAWEPRHPSWFEPEPDALLRAHRIARVAADPAKVPAAAVPGGWPGLAYWRWHGSPRMYWSSYEPEVLDALADRLKASPAAEAWCVFDNTTSGAAAANALSLAERL